ncbi:WD40 repeat domain-containing serine/threonine protein kinase [Micromonospora sp. MH99]|uniref:WD40 repeat domain-containing serine/threonine protein kinase n=1 Tax=Micromonospora sp. MH99 TaxID=1945510 RepID=UPI001F1AD55D|nr:serine/threonine-protein kinase [Micromonospora sp. MH99]MCF0092892.1 Serine/threonine-protein kinase PknA [Micromonospora sp. MH99]
MSDPQPAQRLVAGRYRLESVLGRGGMGVVWRATDELIGRVVAVKEVRAPAGLTGEERLLFGERALREARTAGQINHPAVVAIHDLVPAGGDDEAVYIVTELVDAPTLADLLEREGALPPARVTAIAVRMLDALDAAHSVGVVHRDVKPGNIMVLPGDAVKLLDFGIAQAVGDARLTRHGMMGSTGYLAPELFHGSEPTPAADLWSAGVTLAQAVTGELPFERASTAATLHAVLYDDIPAMTCGEPLATVISGLLTRDVAHRLTVQRARDLLAVPVDAGATGRRDTAASDPLASDGVEADADGDADGEPVGESWERQATTVHPDRSTPPRQRQSAASSPPSTGAVATTFPVEVPEKTRGALVLAQLALIVLTIWAVVLFVEVVTASVLPEWMPIPAALTIGVLAFWTAADAIVDPWHGTLRFGPDSLRFQGARGSPPDLPFKHVASIAVWPGAGSSTGTSRLGIELSARTPAPAHGRVFQGPPQRDGRGPMWIVGDIGMGPKTMAARLGTLVPEHVRIDQSPEVPVWAARAFQPLGPRRPGLLLRFVLVASLILGGHLLVHQRNSTMVTLDDAEVSAVAFSPDGVTLASADAGTFAITFWDVATRKTAAVAAGHREEIKVLVFSPDGKTLASGGRDGVVKLWDVASRQVRATLVFGEYDTVTRLLFSPGGDSIAAVGSGDVKVWPMASLGKPVDLSAGDMGVQTIRFTPDGRVLVGIDGQGGVRAWEATSGRSAARITGPIAPWAEFRSDGDTVIRASGTGAVVATLDGGTTPPDAAAFGPGDLFVTAERGEVRIWHTTTARTVHRYKEGFLDSDVLPSEAVVMAPRGEVVALGGDEGLRLWTYGPSR